MVGGVLRAVSGKASPLRPPGAADEGRFAALCVRCGNCLRACPQAILYPDTGAAGITGLGAPVVRIGPGYCDEWCRACAQVCPTGALERLSLPEKQRVALGAAEVARGDCIAWSRGAYCMVCDEFCPYGAIRSVKHNGVNCPDVDPERCRGCGLCQTVCPAPRTAIIVKPRPQRKLAPVEI